MKTILVLGATAVTVATLGACSTDSTAPPVTSSSAAEPSAAATPNAAIAPYASLVARNQADVTKAVTAVSQCPATLSYEDARASVTCLSGFGDLMLAGTTLDSFNLLYTKTSSQYVGPVPPEIASLVASTEKAAREAERVGGNAQDKCTPITAPTCTTAVIAAAKVAADNLSKEMAAWKPYGG